MAWEVVLTDAVAPDLAQFDDLDVVTADLMAWVEQGPPCTTMRTVEGAVTYEDVTPGGLRVNYFIGVAPRAYVAVVRIRRP